MIVADRFWAKVERHPGDACWPWLGDRHDSGFGYRKGYGRIYWTENGKGYRWFAHRVSYALVYENPGNLKVCHMCDNPICVRPSHLFLGTQRDNMRDCAAKGRGNYAQKGKTLSETLRQKYSNRTTCKNGHAWKTFARPLMSKGVERMVCAQCSRDATNKCYRKRYPVPHPIGRPKKAA